MDNLLNPPALPAFPSSEDYTTAFEYARRQRITVGAFTISKIDKDEFLIEHANGEPTTCTDQSLAIAIETFYNNTV